MLLGLVDLYTTSSRGGWLGMTVVAVSGTLLLLKYGRLPLHIRWLIGVGIFLGLLSTIIVNNRLSALFVSASSLDRQLPQATTSFLKSTQLMPAKRGGFYSLGQTLLLQGKTELGVQAIALEIVRDPIFLTSPLLQTPSIASVYPQVQKEVVRLYQQLLDNHPVRDPLTLYLHQCLGSVYWWQGNLTAATAQWKGTDTPLERSVLAISEDEAISTDFSYPEGVARASTAPSMDCRSAATGQSSSSKPTGGTGDSSWDGAL